MGSNGTGSGLCVAFHLSLDRATMRVEAMYDGRLLHCGGANDSRKRRVLFYFSFKASAGRRTADGTLLATLKKQHTLGSLSGLLA